MAYANGGRVSIFVVPALMIYSRRVIILCVAPNINKLTLKESRMLLFRNGFMFILCLFNYYATL